MKRTRAAILVLAICFSVVSAFGVATTRQASAVAPYYNHNAREGSIVRLYSAYFLRDPEQAGFNYWYMQSMSGWTLHRISDFFSSSPEFQQRYGTLTNAQFIDMVYRNVMKRPADAGGSSYWLGRMGSGLSRGGVMTFFSDSAEYRNLTITSFAPGWRAGSNAKVILAQLRVEPERRTGYDRDLFKHWDDENGNGCDTRCEVLRAEKRRDGTWYSLWDGKDMTAASQSHIDHVVALAEAWDSGAHSWNSSQRDRFADWQPNLTAVSSSSNLSKSDKDAAEWLPPRVASRCAYAELTVSTKFVWNLSVDSAEKVALTGLLNGCTSGSTVIPPVAVTPPPPPPPPPSGCSTTGIYQAANGVCVANYERPNGDVNCSDLPAAAKPVRVLRPGVDPYRLDGNNDGWGCTS